MLPAVLGTWSQETSGPEAKLSLLMLSSLKEELLLGEPWATCGNDFFLLLLAATSASHVVEREASGSSTLIEVSSVCVDAGFATKALQCHKEHLSGKLHHLHMHGRQCKVPGLNQA